MQLMVASLPRSLPLERWYRWYRTVAQSAENPLIYYGRHTPQTGLYVATRFSYAKMFGRS